MTTLREILHDFAMEIAAIDVEGDNPDEWNELRDEIIDDSIEKIKERIIG